MRHLFESTELLTEIDAIVFKVLEQRGYLLTREEAVDVWEKCSEQHAASWLMVVSHYRMNPHVFEVDQEFGRVLSDWVEEYNKRV